MAEPDAEAIAIMRALRLRGPLRHDHLNGAGHPRVSVLEQRGLVERRGAYTALTDEVAETLALIEVT